MAVYDFYGNVIEEANAVHIDALKIKYPSYTDDQLLAAAITLAKEQGKSTKIIWDGEPIYFTGQTTHVCSGFGGIDFNGSKIYMPNYDEGIILSIEPDESSDMEVSASDIEKDYTTSNALKGKIFKMNQTKDGNPDMCLGYRYGDSGGVVLYSSPLVVVSNDGRYETGELYLTPETGTVICYNVHEFPNVTFEVCNATVITHESENMSVFVQCTRSNTHVHNFRLEQQSTTTEFHWGIFVFVGCYSIEVDHISGISPFLKNLTSGYTLGLRSVSGAHVHDVNVGDSTSWGMMGTRSIANTVFERCYLNRWDCHFVQFGFNVIRDCVLNNVRYGLGNGSILIENCTIIQAESSASVVDMIFLRSDCPGVYDGDIIIRGCTFIAGAQDASLINILHDGSRQPKPANSVVSGAPKKRRIIENCQLPEGVYSIVKTGTATAADMSMYENLTYIIKACDISCVNAVLFAPTSGLNIKELDIEHCSVGSGYMVKTLACELKVSNSNIVNISSDTTLPKVTATGNTFSGSQSVSNFTAYAFAGNIASDMSSVNTHS